jgi:hypothetical protein
MLKLEDIKKDAQIRGLEGDKIVRIVHAEAIGTEDFMSIKKANPALNHCFVPMKFA